MSGSPLWSIITVTFNSAAALDQYWQQRLPDDVEWIVVDNASEDGSDRVASRLGATTVIKREVNCGFSRACNIGLHHALGRYVAFVNPDVEIDYTSLPRLATTLDRVESLVGPQLAYPDGSPQPNGRGVPTIWNKIMNRVRPPVGGNAYYRLAKCGEVRMVWWLIGAAVCARRDVIERLGGWDERYFVYYEDSDLGLRAWRARVPVLLDGGARWTHGWARETTRLKLRPWMRELSSMAKFYSRYPEMLLPNRFHDDEMLHCSLLNDLLNDDQLRKPVYTSEG